MIYTYGSENQHRAQEVTRANYIPLSDISEGHMRAMLLAERARMMAQYTQLPEWRKAEQLAQNALSGLRTFNPSGIFNSAPEQYIGAHMMQSKNQINRPASRIGGIGYTDDELNDMVFYSGGTTAPTVTTFGSIWECTWKRFYEQYGPTLRRVNPRWQRWQDLLNTDVYGPLRRANYQWIIDAAERMKITCTELNAVERIYNQHLENSAHHVVYSSINPRYRNMPSRVYTKRLLQETGVHALRVMPEISDDNIRLWLENGIIRTNIKGNVGALSGANTAFFVAGDTQPWNEYRQWVAQDTMKGRIQGIGEPLSAAAIGAIINLIGKAITAVIEIISSIRKRKQDAFIAAQGFGTPALSGAKDDWDPDNPDNKKNKELQSEADNLKMFGLAAVGAAGLLLLSNPKTKSK